MHVVNIPIQKLNDNVADMREFVQQVISATRKFRLANEEEINKLEFEILDSTLRLSCASVDDIRDVSIVLYSLSNSNLYDFFMAPVVGELRQILQQLDAAIEAENECD